MLENPYLAPPRVDSPQSRSWAQGFLFGFEGPPASVTPGTDFAVEDLAAFDEGTLMGQQTAIDGLAVFDDTCIDLNRDGPPDIPELSWAGLEAAAVLKEIPLGVAKLGGMIFGVVTTLVDVSIALQTHYDDAGSALAQAGLQLQNIMSGMSDGASVQFYVGAAVDLAQRGCELKATAVFRNPDDAMQAARNLGRAGQRVVVRWRSDQSGGATVVQSEG